MLKSREEGKSQFCTDIWKSAFFFTVKLIQCIQFGLFHIYNQHFLLLFKTLISIIFTEEDTMIYFTDFLIQGISLFHLLLLLKIKCCKENFEHRFGVIFQIISLELKQFNSQKV